MTEQDFLPSLLTDPTDVSWLVLSDFLEESDRLHDAELARAFALGLDATAAEDPWWWLSLRSGAKGCAGGSGGASGGNGKDEGCGYLSGGYGGNGGYGDESGGHPEQYTFCGCGADHGAGVSSDGRGGYGSFGKNGTELGLA